MEKNNKNKTIYRVGIFCAAVLVCTGFIVANNLSSKKNVQKYDIAVQTPTPAETAASQTEKTVSKPAENVPKTTATVKPSAKPTAIAQPASAEVFDIKKLKISMPTEGKVIQGHSGDTLIYNALYDDWRVHKGVDISAKESAQVKAVADGVIENVYKDELNGVVIEINHDDFKTVYSNLSTDKMVEKGKSVKGGDIISGIGSPNLYSEPHMHFELVYQGVSLDPAPFFSAE